MSVVEHENIVDALVYHAKNQPDKIAFRFLSDFGKKVETLSFSKLLEQTKKIAVDLMEVAEPGDRAALIFSSNRAFVTSLFGALHAGVIPVPALPPSPRRDEDRCAALMMDCEPSVVITHERITDLVKRRLSAMEGFERLSWLEVGDVSEIGGENPESRVRGKHETALLQYTSGSTSTPKGVMVSHHNMVANSEAIKDGFGIDIDNYRPLSWLPLFHDMGLMGHVIMPVYFGVTATLMPTLDFLQQPFSWLRAMSDYGATFSLSPNFAYELCTRRVSPEQKDSINLAPWKCAANGSEPVRIETMEQFVEEFSSRGFKADAFYPAYGLAEATLYVSGGPGKDVLTRCCLSADALMENRLVEVDDGDDSSVVIAGCGQVSGDREVRIVDTTSKEVLGDMEIGEIWFAGPSVCAGYWNRPGLSSEVFGASLPGEKSSFARSGDLGFTRAGELFICGRTKDLIIISGKNHYPQDLELTINRCHPDLSDNSAVAFSVDIENREVLVVACEVNRASRTAFDPAEILGAMRGALFEAHGLGLHEGLLLREGSLPRTTSGKVMRSKCKMTYLLGKFETLGGEDD